MVRRWFFSLLIAIFFVPAAACAADVIGAPYLQDPTETSIVVSWRTTEAIPTRLVVAAGGRSRSFERPALTTAHATLVNNLSSETKYQYSVLGPQNEILYLGEFTTSPPKQSIRPLKIAVFGDSGSGSPNQYAVSDQVYKWRPEVVLHVGDIVYDDGALKDYPKKFLFPYAPWLSSTPFFPSPGNHDMRTKNDYLLVYTLPAERSRSGTELYYSTDYGPVHLIALDTNQSFSSGSAQPKWLKADLQLAAERRMPWIIVFFHHAPFSAGNHGDNKDVQSKLIPIFESSGVDFLLSGHDHAYERTLPLALTSGGRKIPYIVSGAGGESLYSQRSSNKNIAVFKGQYHFVGLTITPQKPEGTAINKDGVVIDQFSISKCEGRSCNLVPPREPIRRPANRGVTRSPATKAKARKHN